MCLAIPGKLLTISAQPDDTFRKGKVSFGGIVKEGRTCTPEHPLGAPMVSSEGACAAYYHYSSALVQA